MINKITNVLNHSETWQNLLLILLVAGVLPFFMLSFYCHPSADDFWLTNIAIAKGSWAAQWEIRQTWSGRYFAMFLASFNPLVYQWFTGYKIIPAFTLLLLGSSIYYFIRQLCCTAISCQTTLLFTLLLLTLYLGFMPVVSQTIYWLSGTISYQFATIGLFLLGGLLINLYKTLPWPKYIISLVLIFGIIGLNETTMAWLVYILFAVLVLNIYYIRSFSNAQLGLLIFAGLCCCLVLVAPGNAVRSAEYPEAGRFFYAIFYAVAVTINNSFNWLTRTPILLVTVIFMGAALKFKVTNQLSKVPLALIWLVYVGGIVVCFFVSYYSKSDHAPPRVQDSIFLLFITGWFLCWWFTLPHLGAVVTFRLITWPKYIFIVIAGFCFYTIFINPTSHIREAYSDLFSGRASRYNVEMHARYTYLKTSNCQTCTIPAVKNIPKTIFFEEIPADTTWKNRYFSQYFGKKLMIIQP